MGDLGEMGWFKLKIKNKKIKIKKKNIIFI